MIIYAVEAGYDYEGYDTISLFDDENLAIAEVEKVREKCGFDEVKYTPIELNESYL